MHKTCADFLRRTATHTGCTPSVPNAHVACFGHISDMHLVYVEFCNFFNMPSAHFTYTLMCDCYLKVFVTIYARDMFILLQMSLQVARKERNLSLKMI